MNNSQDQLEKSNFLTWLNYATTEEILKAIINHKEKFKYLLDKYKADVDALYGLSFPEELKFQPFINLNIE